MKALTTLAVSLSLAGSLLVACASTHHSRPGNSAASDRPYNAMTKQFEDPNQTGHRTSPGDATR